MHISSSQTSSPSSATKYSGDFASGDFASRDFEIAQAASFSEDRAALSLVQERGRYIAQDAFDTMMNNISARVHNLRGPISIAGYRHVSLKERVRDTARDIKNVIDKEFDGDNEHVALEAAKTKLREIQTDRSFPVDGRSGFAKDVLERLER
jgi:hypothetical protein